MESGKAQAQKTANKVINELFDTMAWYDLPMPHSLDLDADTGVVEVNWMLSEDLGASRRVISAYLGDWEQHPASSVREPIYVYTGESLKILLWEHPEAVTMKGTLP